MLRAVGPSSTAASCPEKKASSSPWNLGNKTLTFETIKETIKKKIPGTEMTTLKEDRLKINWPQPR